MPAEILQQMRLLIAFNYYYQVDQTILGVIRYGIVPNKGPNFRKRPVYGIVSREASYIN
jgi:hypothetical protein